MMPDGSSPEALKGMPELSFQGTEWFPSKAGIYFMSHENGKATIELYDTKTQKIRPVFLAGEVSSVLDRRNAGFSGWEMDAVPTSRWAFQQPDDG